MHIQNLWRYPVKGLMGETLENANLVPGRGIPGDRQWALARANKAGMETGGAWQPKAAFHVLEKDAALFDVAAAVGLDDPASLEADVSQRLGLDEGSSARLVRADGPGFFDTLKGEISILNLASLKTVEEAAGATIDPRRFRANIWLQGAEPWEEEGWVGKSAMIGGAQIKFTQLTGRCAATLVNPDTGERDINILKLLKKHFDHTQMGVYAHVTINGDVNTGDELKLKS